LLQRFRDVFGAEAQRLARAPGRVNLIGEHTDYNGGFVLPIALQVQVLVAGRERRDRRVVLLAVNDHDRQLAIHLDAPVDEQWPKWAVFVHGVAAALERRGIAVRGCELAIDGDVPIGSGLSSSAALEVAAGTAMLALSGASLDGAELARVCQEAENAGGVASGIMDPLVCALARRGHALYVDCRDVTYKHEAFPDGAAVVVCDTMRRRSLAQSPYNERRRECEAALSGLQAVCGRQLNSLRDIDREEFESVAGSIPPVLARRVRHVLTENERGAAGVRAMRNGDLVALGRLMNESHESLRDDYEVSCPELDEMVAAARAQEGLLGARLTGAGFGGCTVNLVRSDCLEGFAAAVSRDYRARTGLAPSTIVCRPEAGASLLI
jgi:galactokinase